MNQYRLIATGAYSGRQTVHATNPTHAIREAFGRIIKLSAGQFINIEVINDGTAVRIVRWGAAPSRNLIDGSKYILKGLAIPEGWERWSQKEEERRRIERRRSPDSPGFAGAWQDALGGDAA